MSGDALEARRLTARGVLARALARGLVLGAPPALLALAVGLMKVSLDDGTVGAAALWALVAGVVVGAPAAACGAVELAYPGPGEWARDVLAGALCVLAGAVACTIAVLHARHIFAVFEGRAGVLEYTHLLNSSQLRRPLSWGGVYAALLGVGAYGRRRGYAPLQIVAVGAATVALAATVGSWFRDPHPVFSVADMVCFAAFLALACGALAYVADEGVARLERRWCDRPRHPRATSSSLAPEREDAS